MDYLNEPFMHFLISSKGAGYVELVPPANQARVHGHGSHKLGYPESYSLTNDQSSDHVYLSTKI